MPLVAYNPCVTALGNHTPGGNCIEEGSGILGLGLVRKGFDLNTIIDATTYTAAKTGNNIKVVKDVEAFWPSAGPQTIPGFAGRMERLGHFQWELPFKHYGVDANLVFWNTVNQDQNWGIFFVTEEYKVFAPLDRDLEPVLCHINCRPAGDQEFGKQRFFEGVVRWKHVDLPQFVDTMTKTIIRADYQP